MREIGAIITRELTFNATLVTVQAVDLTPDFKHCHIYVGVLGSEVQQKAAIGKLSEHRPLLQHELSRRVILKYTPHLHFHLDHALERGTKVMEIMRQLEETAPLTPEQSEDEAPTEESADDPMP